LKAIVDAYLTMEHRDRAELGCVIAALAAEATRLDAPTRGAIAEGFEALAALIAAQLPGPQDEALRSARAIVATLVGALTIARAVADRDLAQSLLRSARDAVLRR
jgi:TetR/AcrR family transcriptional repressor of nem operon